MTDTTVYDTMNNLPDTIMMGSTSKTLTFTCYKENGLDLLDISTGVLVWSLYPYGDTSNVVIYKEGTISDSNTFVVNIEPSDTPADLVGKYIQQIIVRDSEGNTFIPGQGIFIILPTAFWR
jgi:hypothetical protein